MMRGFLLGCAWLAAAVAAAPARAADRPVVVVFDFVSGFDGGRLGKFVANNLWAKLDRTGRCVLVEQQDVNDLVARAGFVAGFDDKPADIVKFAADRFGATHALWGKVEKAGDEGLLISARSAGVADKGKKLGLDLRVKIKNPRETQLATREFVRRFLRLSRPAPDVGPAEEERWRKGPNLVRNGGFELGTEHPQFWEPIRDDPKHPQHRCVSWVPSPEGKGKCIRFVIPRNIAATYGVAYYSDPISIADGEVYRIRVRAWSDGPTVKIFVKHYRFFPPGPDEKKGQWRETRRAPMNCTFDRPRTWQTFTRDFRPHRDDHGGRFDPTISRIELYAYWPKGTVYFDDVVLKKLKDRKKK